MNAGKGSQASDANNRMSVQRKSDRELVVTRIVDAPTHIVFQAWTSAELFQRWWVPKSHGLTLLSCELDVRVGGVYREVDPPKRLIEGGIRHGFRRSKLRASRSRPSHPSGVSDPSVVRAADPFIDLTAT